MPCDTVRLTTIDASKYDVHTLKTALEEMGFTTRIDTNGHLSFADRYGRNWAQFDGKRIIAPAGMIDETQLAREYARAKILKSAKQRGWTVKETSRFELEVTKRK